MDVTSEQRTWARVAAISILAKYVLELSGDYVTIIARGGETFAETARYAETHPLLWRAALLSVGGSWIAIGVLAYALYVVLEPVNKRLAELAFVLRLGASFVGAASLMFRFARARLYLASATADLFTSEQLRTLDSVLGRGAGAGIQTSWIFMGAGEVIFYLLFLRSGYLPRTLARLGIVGAALVVAMSLVMFVYPAWINQLKLVGVPGLLVEIVTAVWLLSKGLQARARAEPTA
jgi:hypothetical protein